MKCSTTKILAAALLLAAGMQSAYASSVNKAGADIENTASVTFSVGGVVQTIEPEGSATFTVDRLVDVVVASAGNTNTTPGASSQALRFTVTNNTNSTMDIALSAANATGDQFDAGAFTYYVDGGVLGTFEPGTDTLVTHLDEVPSDGVRNVWVVANIPNPASPNSLQNGDLANVVLTAIAHDSNGAATLGGLTAETAGANTAGIDNVFGDDAGETDGAEDGMHSDIGAFVISSAAIGVTKSSGVLEDPFNGTTNPKAIPGATIVYCIAISNTGTADATNVTVTDNIPGNTTYDANTIRVVNGAVAACDATAAAAGMAITDAADGVEDVPSNTSGDAGVGGAGPVTTVTNLDAGNTTTTVFQVTITE